MVAFIQLRMISKCFWREYNATSICVCGMLLILSDNPYHRVFAPLPFPSLTGPQSWASREHKYPISWHTLFHDTMHWIHHEISNRVSHEERSIFWEVIVSVILRRRKKVIWTCVLFRTVSDIWRAIYSFSPAVMRHCLKHVNRCEASVGCCNCCWLVPLFYKIVWQDKIT
jgi:hypothetical protein